MYDRGHHRRLPRGGRGRGGDGGRGAPDDEPPARPHRRSPPSRSTRRRRRTSTTRSRSSATATTCGCTSTSPTSPRSCARQRRSTPRRSGAATASTCRARSSRCCRARSRTRPAAWCRAPAAGGDRRDAARARRAGAQRLLLPQHDPLGRAAHLRGGGRSLRRRASAPRRSSPSRSRSRASSPPRCGASALARGALAVESSEPEFEFDDRGDVIAARDEIQTESHWVIEHLMILANEQVAERLAAARVATIYRVHEQPDPASVERLVAQLASLDVPTPPLPEHMTPAARRASWSVRSAGACSSTSAATGPGRQGARLARAALAQAGGLLAAQHRARGPREQRVLPLHVADPALSGPGRPPRLLVDARARADGAAAARRSTRWPRAAARPSARRRRSSATPTTSASPSCSSATLGERAGSATSRARSSGVIESGRVRELRPRRRRRGLRGLPPRAPHARRLLRPERGAHGAGRPQQPGDGCASATRSTVAVRSVDAPRGRVDLDLATGRTVSAKKRTRPRGRATSRPTARRGSATTCSRSGRSGSRSRAPR